MITFITDEQYSWYTLNEMKYKMKNKKAASTQKAYVMNTNITFFYNNIKTFSELKPPSVTVLGTEAHNIYMLLVVHLTNVKGVAHHQVTKPPKCICHGLVGPLALQPVGRQSAFLLFCQTHILFFYWKCRKKNMKEENRNYFTDPSQNMKKKY